MKMKKITRLVQFKCCKLEETWENQTHLKGLHTERALFLQAKSRKILSDSSKELDTSRTYP